MSALIPASGPRQTMAGLHALFLLMLPRIEQHAQIHFRHVRCPQQKDDAIAEAVALSWKWVIGLSQRGRDASAFVSTLAMLAARAVRSGRRLCGQEKARDVLSARAQQRQSFVVQKLPDYSTRMGNVLEDALCENTVTSIPEQVAFRCDFPVWLGSLSDRDGRIVDCLAQGERTLDVAQRFRLSPARVSQLRREFQHDWQMFCGDVSAHDERCPAQQA